MTEIVPVSVGGLAPRLQPRPADRNPYVVYIATRKSPATRDTMIGCLGTIARLLGYEFAEALPWEHLRAAHTDRLAVLLREQTSASGEPWSPATVNKHLSALRGVLKQAWRLGLVGIEDYQRAADVQGDTGTRLPPGRSIADAETAAMLRICLDKTLSGTRNAALVALLSATGARRAEGAAARREHYDPGSRTLRIIGKGDKQREVYVNEDAAVYVGAWLAQLDGRTGPLFVPINRWGQMAARHMTPRAVGDIIDSVRLAAKLPPLTTHDFRRTFIGQLLDDGADLSTAQALAGHALVTTTARYDRRPAATRRAAANRLKLPRPEDLVRGD